MLPYACCRMLTHSTTTGTSVHSLRNPPLCEAARKNVCDPFGRCKSEESLFVSTPPTLQPHHHLCTTKNKSIDGQQCVRSVNVAALSKWRGHCTWATTSHRSPSQVGCVAGNSQKTFKILQHII